jgi:hypothetical protein
VISSETRLRHSEWDLGAGRRDRRRHGCRRRGYRDVCAPSLASPYPCREAQLRNRANHLTCRETQGTPPAVDYRGPGKFPSMGVSKTAPETRRFWRLRFQALTAHEHGGTALCRTGSLYLSGCSAMCCDRRAPTTIYSPQHVAPCAGAGERATALDEAGRSCPRTNARTAIPSRPTGPVRPRSPSRCDEFLFGPKVL